jgi:hypothetical protein
MAAYHAGRCSTSRVDNKTTRGGQSFVLVGVLSHLRFHTLFLLEFLRTDAIGGVVSGW